MLHKELSKKVLGGVHMHRNDDNITVYIESLDLIWRYDISIPCINLSLSALARITCDAIISQYKKDILSRYLN